MCSPLGLGVGGPEGDECATEVHQAIRRITKRLTGRSINERMRLDQPRVSIDLQHPELH